MTNPTLNRAASALTRNMRRAAVHMLDQQIEEVTRSYELKRLGVSRFTYAGSFVTRLMLTKGLESDTVALSNGLFALGLQASYTDLRWLDTTYDIAESVGSNERTAVNIDRSVVQNSGDSAAYYTLSTGYLLNAVSFMACLRWVAGSPKAGADISITQERDYAAGPVVIRNETTGAWAVLMPTRPAGGVQ